MFLYTHPTSTDDRHDLGHMPKGAASTCCKSPFHAQHLPQLPSRYLLRELLPHFPLDFRALPLLGVRRPAPLNVDHVAAERAIDNVPSLDARLLAIEPPAPNFAAANGAMDRQLTTLDAGDMAPTEPQLRTYAAACADLKAAVATWKTLASQDLASLNATLAKNSLKPIPVPSAALPLPACSAN